MTDSWTRSRRRIKARGVVKGLLAVAGREPVQDPTPSARWEDCQCWMWDHPKDQCPMDVPSGCTVVREGRDWDPPMSHQELLDHLSKMDARRKRARNLRKRLRAYVGMAGKKPLPKDVWLRCEVERMWDSEARGYPWVLPH